MAVRLKIVAPHQLPEPTFVDVSRSLAITLMLLLAARQTCTTLKAFRLHVCFAIAPDGGSPEVGESFLSR